MAAAVAGGSEESGGDHLGAAGGALGRAGILS